MDKYDNPFHDPQWKKKAIMTREIPEKHIPMFEGRPERDTAINSDDCINVRIALETTDNVKEFLEMIA